MSQRSAFQVQILEKLGAPLMGAVAEVAARQRKDGEDTQKQEAERLAELLAKTVQVSVGLAGSMDLKDTDGQADSARLKALLAQYAGGQCQVAIRYRNDKGECDIRLPESCRVKVSGPLLDSLSAWLDERNVEVVY